MSWLSETINIQGEIFGLLGANGAGKTTTFQMITGEIAMTEGKTKWHDMTNEKDMVGHDMIRNNANSLKSRDLGTTEILWNKSP